MAYKIKAEFFEVYCEDFSISNSVLKIGEYVSIDKQGIGEGAHIPFHSSEITISSVEEDFNQIKKEAWKYIRENVPNINTNTQPIDDYYKDQGMAIFIKGKLAIGIHPDNLENNLKALKNNIMTIDWGNYEKYL